jgi:hypothetical protein
MLLLLLLVVSISDPVIMSRNQNYGVTDLGPDGISTFFARHRCTRFCQPHWTQPRNTAVHYSRSSCTYMELRGEQHVYGDGDDDDSSSSSDDDWYHYYDD